MMEEFEDTETMMKATSESVCDFIFDVKTFFYFIDYSTKKEIHEIYNDIKSVEQSRGFRWTLGLIGRRSFKKIA